MSGGSCLARGRQFAKDSMLERDGFEPLVPHKKQPFLAAPVRSRNSPSATKTGCFVPGTDGSNPSPSSAESATNQPTPVSSVRRKRSAREAVSLQPSSSSDQGA